MARINATRITRFAAVACGAIALMSCRGQDGDIRVAPLTPAERERAIAAQDAFKAAAIAEVGVAGGWERAELVPGEVNSPGWEDSAFISGDGNELDFQYFPGDLFRAHEVLKYHRPKSEGGLGADPALYDRYHRGPPRGVTPAYTSDTFVARLAEGRFAGVSKAPYSRDGRNEWGAMRSAAGDVYYVTHDPTKEMNRDIYRNGQRLPVPGAGKYQEDNPHFVVTRHGRELFFDCDDRPASKGKGHIWLTREVDGRFTDPVLLANPVNVDGSTEVQPHLASDGKLYFTTARDGVVAIHASDRTGENAWGPAQRILWPTRSSRPRLWGVGEPPLTDDGRWLYFVAIFENERGEFDADVARVRRKGGAPAR